MVEGKRRSRTLRRIMKRTPGGVTRKFYVKRKSNQAHCSRCGTPLPGTPRASARQLQKMSATKKRPNRPFGGYFCTRCMRAEIIKRVRQ
jgi:large subunit ribosomal protein L34e